MRTEVLTTTQYYAVAMITVLLYEYILLLPDEVRTDLIRPCWAAEPLST